MKIVAGVDGGQSGSRAALGDERGVLARVTGRPLATAGQPDNQFMEELEALLRHARSEAGLLPDQALEAVVAGVSGQDEGVAVTLARAGRARVLHDAEIAHAGAFGGGPGIVVVAGSGSVAFGTDDAGARARRGGWGRTFGDGGSAFWIGRCAIGTAMRTSDEGVTSRIADAACTLFGVASLRDLQRAALRGAVAPDELAGFAPSVLALAADGDEVAAAVLQAAADELALLALAVDRALGPREERPVSFVGGTFADAGLRAAFESRVREVVAGAQITAPQGDPVLGALRLAYADANIAAPQRASVP